MIQGRVGAKGEEQQLPDLAVQIVDHLLRILGRRCLAAARKQSPARFTSSCFQLLIIVR
jgi:hypothetical protein